MGIWAVLPVKPLRRGKSRLSGVLGQAERTALNHCLLENTLRVLQQVPQIEHTLVISRDPQALSLARSFGARTLLENSDSNLNQALELATALIRRITLRGVLVIPADLPLLTQQDLEAVLGSLNRQLTNRAKGSKENELSQSVTKPAGIVVIAPDRHYQGTNAMLVSPPGLIRYAFGIGSFKRHCELARQAGALLELVERPALAMDLDFPEDLAMIQDFYIDTELSRAAPVIQSGEYTPIDSQPEQHCLEMVKLIPHLSHEGGPDE